MYLIYKMDNGALRGFPVPQVSTWNFVCRFLMILKGRKNKEKEKENSGLAHCHKTKF